MLKKIAAVIFIAGLSYADPVPVPTKTPGPVNGLSDCYDFPVYQTLPDQLGSPTVVRVATYRECRADLQARISDLQSKLVAMAQADVLNPPQ